jgi:hypothetical protein
MVLHGSGVYIAEACIIKAEMRNNEPLMSHRDAEMRNTEPFRSHRGLHHPDDIMASHHDAAPLQREQIITVPYIVACCAVNHMLRSCHTLSFVHLRATTLRQVPSPTHLGVTAHVCQARQRPLDQCKAAHQLLSSVRDNGDCVARAGACLSACHR